MSWRESWNETEKIGKGGQGRTFLATNRGDPAIMAVVKELNNNKSPQARRRMAREAFSLEQLGDVTDKVPKLLDHNTQQYADNSTVLFIAMELIRGPTLLEYVRTSNRIEMEAAIAVTNSLLTIYELGLEHDITHRDIKPSNIIIQEAIPSRAILVDYGLSHNLLISGDDPLTNAEDTFRNKFLDLPETNTPGNMCRDPRSDITAICGIFFYCLTGQIPGQLRDGLDLPPHRRASVDSDLAKRLACVAKIFDKGFSVALPNRYQTSSEFRADLQILSDGEPNSLSSIANSLTSELIASNSDSKRAYLSDSAGRVMKQVNLFVNANRHLGHFSLDLVSGRATNYPISKIILNQNWVLRIKVRGHETRLQAFVVATEGVHMDCILKFGEHFAGSPNTYEQYPPIEWIDIFHFGPQFGNTAYDSLNNEIVRWLGGALTRLKEYIEDRD